MKDSGSVWFEEIPCNWVMKRIKYLFHIKKDIAGKEGYTVLSITQKGIQPKDLSKNEGQIAANYSQYQLLAPGDFAMNHMDLLTGWLIFQNILVLQVLTIEYLFLMMPRKMTVLTISI